jgi:putative spermidine/putrescine transport system ATP-binding protein
VLLLDEPLSALDTFLRVRMRIELKRLQTKLGIPFVHVTHGQDEALALADLIVVMNKGKIEQAGSAREVFETPATEFVARFLGGHNVIRTPVGLIAVRADRTKLARNGETNALPATVTGVEYQGASYAIALEGEGVPDLSAVVGDADFLEFPVAVGDRVGLVWSEADVQPVSPAS